MKSFVQRWLITTLAVLVAANIVSGIHYDSVPGLFVASLVLGILNAVLRPLLLVLALPLLLFTLGLFTLVINGVLLFLVGQLVRTFHVDSFGAAFWGALIISIVSVIVNSLAGSGEAKIAVRRQRRPRGTQPKDDKSGPVIDV